MTEQIVSKAATRSRARAAFEAGEPRDAHHMNWHAAAVEVWQAEWDRMAALRRADAAPSAASRRKQAFHAGGAQ